jgi:integrase
VRGAVRKPRTPGGTWSYRVDLGIDGASGRRRQQQVGGFATKREAQTGLNAALAALDQGTYASPAKGTLGEFIDEWLVAVKPELGLSAWLNYRTVLTRHVLPRLGDVRLGELTGLRLQRLYTELLASGRVDGGPLSPRSVQLTHRVLHRALGDAVRWRLLPINPADQARAPKVVRKEQRVWTIDEATQFLDAVVDERLVALWTVALQTGMRRGELAGLRWKDIDLAAGSLTVAQQRTTAGFEPLIQEPKVRSRRTLLLAPVVVRSLESHRRRQLEERLAAGAGWRDSGYVFVDELGVEYHPQRFRIMFDEACHRAGVPSIRLHDLRHTIATLALTAGIHPKVVQEMLGHSGIAVTLDIYSHVPQAAQRDAADRVASLFATKP